MNKAIMIAVFVVLALAGIILVENGITGMFAASESCCFGPYCDHPCDAAEPATPAASTAFWLGITLCGIAVFYLVMHKKHSEHDF